MQDTSLERKKHIRMQEEGSESKTHAGSESKTHAGSESKTHGRLRKQDTGSEKEKKAQKKMKAQKARHTLKTVERYTSEHVPPPTCQLCGKLHTQVTHECT